MVAFHCVDGKRKAKFFFSEKVPAAVLQRLQANTPKSIAGLGLMAAVLAVDLLKDLLLARRVFIFC